METCLPAFQRPDPLPAPVSGPAIGSWTSTRFSHLPALLLRLLSGTCPTTTPQPPACSLLFINPLLLALLSFLSFDSGICYHLAVANPFVFPMKWSQKPSALEGHEHLFPPNLQDVSSKTQSSLVRPVNGPLLPQLLGYSLFSTRRPGDHSLERNPPLPETFGRAPEANRWRNQSPWQCKHAVLTPGPPGRPRGRDPTVNTGDTISVTCGRFSKCYAPTLRPRDAKS
ncbi:uncharacterized protein [Bos indicus]|uniref:Uncharacterized protein isoform X2 n=1 Tax=Bos indicus TaxID=9915 RepID=A0ABM4QNH7_BOSIN